MEDRDPPEPQDPFGYYPEPYQPEIRQIIWHNPGEDIGVSLTDPNCLACGGSGIMGDFVYYDDDGTKYFEPDFCFCTDYIGPDRKDYYIVIGEEPPVIKYLTHEAAPKMEGGESPE